MIGGGINGGAAAEALSRPGIAGGRAGEAWVGRNDKLDKKESNTREK